MARITLKQLPLEFKTRHGLDPFECLSAMQKCVRRGLEREAMKFACELVHTDKARCSMVCKRLEVISHEVIGLANPAVVTFVKAACDQAREWYDPNPKKIGYSRMAIGNAIRILCRSQKSREGDHFQAAIGLPNLWGTHQPAIPDWALDKHTKRGRAFGRGIEQFRKAGAKLDPQPLPDQYEQEAYALWVEEERRNKTERAIGGMYIEEDD